MIGHPKFIQVSVNGVVESHIDSWNQNWATLCGLDGDDPLEDQHIVGASDSVTCKQCIAIWDTCHKVNKKNLKRD